jgi:hypothetical protein
MKRISGLVLIVIIVAACAQPDATGCTGDYLDPASEMDSIEAWWMLDVRSAVTGERAGKPYDSTATHLNPGGLASLIILTQPRGRVVVANEAFALLRATSAGAGIIGSNSTDDGTQIAHIVAVVLPEGDLRFLGACAVRFETPFRSMVEANYPSSSEADVLLEAARAMDFSELIEWTGGEGGILDSRRTGWTSDDLGGFQSGLTVASLPEGFAFIESEATADGARSAVMHRFESGSGHVLVIGRLRGEIAQVVPGRSLTRAGRVFVVGEDSRGTVVSEDLGDVVVVTISPDMSDNEVIKTASGVTYDESRDP